MLLRGPRRPLKSSEGCHPVAIYSAAKEQEQGCVNAKQQEDEGLQAEVPTCAYGTYCNYCNASPALQQSGRCETKQAQKCAPPVSTFIGKVLDSADLIITPVRIRLKPTSYQRQLEGLLHSARVHAEATATLCVNKSMLPL